MAKDKSEYNKQIIELYKSGETYQKISKILNVSMSYAYRIVTAAGLGRKIKTRLNEDQQKELCQMYLSKISPQIIAQKFSISITVVRDYLIRNNVERDKSLFKKYFPNPNFFDELTENNLWFLGWIYSDGCLHRKSWQFQITVGDKDSEVLYKLGSISHLEDKYCVYKNRDNTYMLKGTSREFCQKLKELGVQHAKSLTIEYPNFFTEEWQHAAFMRGVFEGDGCVSLKGSSNSCSVEIASGSQKFCEGIQKVLHQYLNIKSKIKFRTRDIFIREQVSKNATSGRVVIQGSNSEKIKFLDWIYKNGNAEYYLDRKFQKYKAAKHKHENPVYRYENINKDRVKTIWMTSPEGEIWKITNVQAFGRSNGLSPSRLMDVYKEKPSFCQHKGWRKYSYNPENIPQFYKTFSVI